MKKILLSLSIIGLFWWFFVITSANNTDCKEVKFNNNITACVNLENAGSNRRELTTDLDAGSTANLRCDIMTPDNGLRSVSACNGKFTYNGNEVGRIKLWIRYSNAAPIDWEDKPSSSSERTYPQWIYHFGSKKWFDDGYNQNNYSNTNTIDNFYIISSTSSPNEDQYIDITIKARDGSSTDNNYRGTVKFKVERKYWSSRIEASSSYYTLERTSYTFNSTDAGIHKFTNFIKFKNNNYDYRLVIYDNNNNNIEGYKNFYINDNYNDYNNNNYYNTDNFYVSTDDSTPNQYQTVDLTIRAKDGSYTDTTYRGTIDFEVRYREIGNNYRTKTTSLSYYEMKYPYENNGLTFYSSNNGQVTITDFISFKRKGYEYKIIVNDDNNNIEWYKIFTVNDDASYNSDTNDLYISTNDSTPSLYQRINLGIRARDGYYTDTSYRGTVDFEIYYKTSWSSTWTRTFSSNYYTMHSSYEDGFTFSSSQNGYASITNFIKFNKSNYSYKVVVYDQDDENILGEYIFTVGNIDNSYSNINGFTTSELNTVKGIYNGRKNMITNLKTEYPTLKTHTTRLNMSNDLYDEMEKILNNESNREYDDYDSFYDAFLDRYNYTVRIR